MFSLGLKSAVRSVIDSVHATRHKEPWLPHWRQRAEGPPLDRDSLSGRLENLGDDRLVVERSKGEPDRRSAMQSLVKDVADALACDDGPRAIAAARPVHAEAIRVHILRFIDPAAQDVLVRLAERWTAAHA